MKRITLLCVLYFIVCVLEALCDFVVKLLTLSLKVLNLIIINCLVLGRRAKTAHALVMLSLVVLLWVLYPVGTVLSVLLALYSLFCWHSIPYYTKAFCCITVVNCILLVLYFPLCSASCCFVEVIIIVCCQCIVYPFGTVISIVLMPPIVLL